MRKNVYTAASDTNISNGAVVKQVTESEFCPIEFIAYLCITTKNLRHEQLYLRIEHESSRLRM